jgi:hypothetical protein
MKQRIEIPPGIDGFVEDKDLARELRRSRINPALEAGDEIVLDFANVRVATQSFVHALIGEALTRFGEAALRKIEFRNCSEQLRSVIDLVVTYSFTGFFGEEVSRTAR